MKKRLLTVIKETSGNALAKAMGMPPPNMVRLKRLHPNAWVHFEDGEPVRIEYRIDKVIHKKTKKE